jgi:hypothetical protein
VFAQGILIRLSLSRECIANCPGIARETVSRRLGQLESEQLIRSVVNKIRFVLAYDGYQLMPEYVDQPLVGQPELRHRGQRNET